ncbi:MAG: PTS glucose transporter subunit IIBC [Clostridiales bacterium]|nr:PTS glucose transporter subunit IIBC [Clostridiales bacterium]
MKWLQRLGKSLMLPIAVLPICGILMGIGYILCPASMQGGEITGVGPCIGFLMVKAGGAVIDNLALLFAISVALGFSDDNHGSACLAGLTSWLIVTTLLNVSVVQTIMPEVVEGTTKYLAFSKVQNAFIGIITGLIGAVCYNRFKNVKLPDAFAFFSGRRFVSIITAFASLIAAALLLFIWPALFGLLVRFGEWIAGLGPVGAGIYAFLNRLLIPFGLHHALNNVFWFDTIGLGDLTNFWAGKTSADVSWSLGMYMSGFFPCMMFGIPGAALAMYTTQKEKKKRFGILFPATLCSFLCGLSEPFEFLFMFTAFPLYIVYALLYGVFTYISAVTGFRAGFSFSAGAVDLAFSSSLPAAQKTWLIIPLGLAAFVIYFLVFRLIIKKFGDRFPGLNDIQVSGDDNGKGTTAGHLESGFVEKLITALGGRKNIVSVDCCATRLRIETVDSSVVDKDRIKAAGALGVNVMGAKNCNIIIGLKVQQVCDEMLFQLKNEDRKETSALPEYITHNDEIFIPKKEKIQSGDGTACVTYTARDPLGIHARPAGELVKLLKQFNCHYTVIANGKKVIDPGILDIMGLGVTCGTALEIRTKGPDANNAAEKIEALLKEKF